jgi:hypothetical protein
MSARLGALIRSAITYTSGIGGDALTQEGNAVEREEILEHLQALDVELGRRDVKGEVCLYGGAVMCLVFRARPSTKDVDAVFEPAATIRDAARIVAERADLPPDWLNDAVKGFVTEHPRQVFIQMPNLAVYVADADYLLAMKAMAARIDGTDNADIRFLIRHLGLTTPQDVFAVVEKYYPLGRIKPATQFFVEEIFDNP